MSKETVFPRDSFVFYRSFLEAINDLSDSEACEALNAICAYALDGVIPELPKGAVRIVFNMAKPQIDSNTKRYINGHKGAEHGVKGAEFGKLGGRPPKK